MKNEPEHNPEPEQAAGPQPIADPHAELMEQIRRALILDGGLGPRTREGGGGFDPYNSRRVTPRDQWRVRRRD